MVRFHKDTKTLSRSSVGNDLRVQIGSFHNWEYTHTKMVPKRPSLMCNILPRVRVHLRPINCGALFNWKINLNHFLIGAHLHSFISLIIKHSNWKLIQLINSVYTNIFVINIGTYLICYPRKFWLSTIFHVFRINTKNWLQKICLIQSIDI